MSSELISAVIGAGAGILGTLITVFQDEIKSLWKTKDARFIGSWEGTGGDISVPERLIYDNPLSFSVTMDIAFKRGQLTGELKITAGIDGEQRSHTAVIESVHLSGDFFSFRFRLKDVDASHFGLMLFRVQPSGKSMEGFSLAKKIYEHKIGFAGFKLKKRP